MRVIAIDPHATRPYAFVIFEDGKLVQSGNATLKEIHNMLGKEVDLVIIETQYLQHNVKTMAALATSKGKVLGWCETHDIPYVEVWPAQWQSNVGFNKKPKESKEAAKEKKQAIRKTVARNYGVVDDCQQNAILMYHWWRDNEQNGDV